MKNSKKTRKVLRNQEFPSASDLSHFNCCFSKAIPSMTLFTFMFSSKLEDRRSGGKIYRFSLILGGAPKSKKQNFPLFRKKPKSYAREKHVVIIRCSFFENFFNCLETKTLKFLLFPCQVSSRDASGNGEKFFFVFFTRFFSSLVEDRKILRCGRRFGGFEFE